LGIYEGVIIGVVPELKKGAFAPPSLLYLIFYAAVELLAFSRNFRSLMSNQRSDIYHTTKLKPIKIPTMASIINTGKITLIGTVPINIADRK
jgi:hypothetical protein